MVAKSDSLIPGNWGASEKEGKQERKRIVIQLFFLGGGESGKGQRTIGYADGRFFSSVWEGSLARELSVLLCFSHDSVFFY